MYPPAVDVEVTPTAGEERPGAAAAAAAAAGAPEEGGEDDGPTGIDAAALVANVCTAQFLSKLSLPVLYRVHDGPNMDKLDNLKAFLKEMGIQLTRSALHFLVLR